MCVLSITHRSIIIGLTAAAVAWYSVLGTNHLLTMHRALVSWCDGLKCILRISWVQLFLIMWCVQIKRSFKHHNNFFLVPHFVALRIRSSSNRCVFFLFFKIQSRKRAIHNRYFIIWHSKWNEEKWTKFGSILNYSFRRCVNV